MVRWRPAWRDTIGIHPIVADEPVQLVELDIEGSAEGFDFGEITQEVPGQPPSNWQAVYDEREVGQNRCAFYFHYLDTTKPLLSPAGPLALPPVSPVPEHLQGIEYEPPERPIAASIGRGRWFCAGGRQLRLGGLNRQELERLQ